MTTTRAAARTTDPYLELLLRVAASGDATFRYGGADRLLVQDLEGVYEILARGADELRITAITEAVQLIQGDGLLVSSLPRWRPRRLIIQRQLGPSKLRPKAQIIARNTRALLDGWSTGDTFDLRGPMHALALDNLGDVIFGTDFRSVRDVIREAMEATMVLLEEANVGGASAATTQRLEDAVDELDVLVGDLISARTGNDDARTDILEVLVGAARSGEEVFADPWARDEAVTLILAGHDAIAFLTTMCAWLLATHPDVLHALRRQVDAALAEDVDVADLPQAAPLTKQVVEEALRLYPPVPVMHRTAPEGLELAGQPVRAGVMLVLSPWVSHRDERYFPNAEAFDPDRFSAERRSAIPKHAYYPFGAGRRICAGNHFTLLQSAITVGLMSAAVDLDVGSAGPALVAPVGLRVDEPLPVTVVRR